MQAYRPAVAVVFGLIGFGVNFLDMTLIETQGLKINILAGLFFPLVIALAWGWRYGLVSALAGGCQSMWWLWYGDGWGVLYSVPVFTAWIVWHGWWAERGRQAHPWYISSFIVEIPFRVVVELGFYTVFPLLVSLNPPPWDPGIIWSDVQAGWVHTVAVKHAVTGYILLLGAYAGLSLGPVRKFFGIPPVPGQRDAHAIYAGAVLLGLSLCALDAGMEFLATGAEGKTFWDAAVLDVDSHEMFSRLLYVLLTLAAAAFLVRFNRNRALLRERLDHLSRVLAAIRNVNQVIVRENDPDRLLDKVCRLLVETSGYYNSWIVLTENNWTGKRFFHAGFDWDFKTMGERLLAEDPPACAKAALCSSGIQVVDDPPSQCLGCPLASSYEGRAGLCLRLEHGDSIFGWLSLSCSALFAHSAEEHDLLKEVAGDIAFALWSMETAVERESLAHKYAAVLATTSDAVIACDLDGVITVFNAAAEKLFKCSAGEALGSPLRRFCPEDRLDEQAEMMRRLRETGGVSGYETERVASDGRRLMVEITLSLNTDVQGRIQGTNAIVRDITERKRAEAEARQNLIRRNSEADVVAAIAASEDLAKGRVRAVAAQLTEAAACAIGVQRAGVWLFDDDCTRLVNVDNYVASTGEHYSGAVLQENEYKNEFDALKMDKYVAAHDAMSDPRTAGYVKSYLKPNRITSMLDGVIRSGGVNLGTVCFEHVDNPHIWEIDEIAFVCQLADQVAMAVMNRKERCREQEKASMEKQLRQAQKMEAIGTLAGGIAHDFNNILSPIMVYAEMLMMDLPEDSPAQPGLKQIYTAGERARDLVRQILTFARKKEEDRIPLKASVIIKEAVKFLRSTLPSTLELVLDVRTNQDTVLADPTELNQIVMNLCTNAAHAMENAGGRIEIVLEKESVDAGSPVHPADLGPGPYLKVTVRDTGPGIEPNVLERIFDPYFTTKAAGKGTGMGLAVVHGIVKSCGGSIAVESGPGLGARFDVLLPVVGGAVEAFERGNKREALPRGSERVLLVDDEPWAVEAVGSMLEHLGYEVTGYEGSAGALEAFRENPGGFDLVITDMTMPQMTGKDLARELLGIRPSTPIILCTGFSEKIDEPTAARMGIRAYVMKPIVMKDIARTIREVLQ